MFRPDESAELDARRSRSISRREALRRLGGWGLAAIGAATLGPAAAAATTKKRATRRLGESAAAAAADRYPADVVPADDPSVADPGDPPDSSWIPEALLEIVPRRGGRVVRVSVSIDFSEADLAAIRAGQRCRLACEIWEEDDGNLEYIDPETDQFVFAFPGRTIPDGPPRRGPIVFERWVPRSRLDLDRPNPDRDEIVGLVILTTPSGQIITQMTNVIAKEYGS